MLLAVSRVNESVPLFLVEGIKRRLGDLRERKVAVLGLAFKGDTDDERDSLSHKLIRLLERELADVAVHDPLVATPTPRFDDAVSRRRRRRRGDEPLRVLGPRGARRDRARLAAATASSSTRGTRSAPPRCSPTPRAGHARFDLGRLIDRRTNRSPQLNLTVASLLRR